MGKLLSLKIRELHLAHLQGSRQGLIDCGAQIIAILGIFHFLLVNQIAHIKMEQDFKFQVCSVLSQFGTDRTFPAQ